MNKLRTIIRLYEEQTGLKTIAVMARASRNTVKKYIQKWNTLDMSYETFLQKSETELHELFCVREGSIIQPRLEELENLMPDICKELGKRGMIIQQWDKYWESHPDGYGLPCFRLAIQCYRKITNPSMRMEHNRKKYVFFISLSSCVFISLKSSVSYLSRYRSITSCGSKVCWFY